MTARSGVMAVLTTLALLVAGAAVLAAPAAAASRDGHCDSGEFCYFFNSDEQGSISDFVGSLDDYGATQPTCYEFKGAGNGKGLCVKNNAASVWNRTGKTVRVYFNSNFAGHSQDFAAGAKGNLDATLKNNNASHQLLGSGGGCSSDGNDTTLPSSILVYRAGSGAIDRVAFKTYVKNVLPNEWKASWDADALKAGAMAVKSFGWYWALHSDRKTSDGRCFDVYDDTRSQVYKPGSAVTSTSNAVDATWGTRLARSGHVLQAHYCATTTACGSSYVDGDWMSQYGSQDRAEEGKGWQTILRYYYDGITLD
ncbi:SpoIID/LytB domain-containing protein [Jatrophihabitans fulvus]